MGVIDLLEKPAAPARGGLIDDEPTSHRNRRYAITSLLWCAAALTIKPFYAYVDFGAFYATAIEKILSGAPLDIYAFVARPPGSTLALPLTNPPVWFFFLAPWYALGEVLGIADFQRQAGFSLGQAWMLIIMLPLDILLCWSVVLLAEHKGRLPEPKRWTLFCCLILSPLLWLSSVRFGHNESMMVLFVLLAVLMGEKDRPALSGLFWGLALGIKTTAVVPALAYLGWGLGKERRRVTMRCWAVAAATFVLPILPYLLFRREQISYALAGFEGLRPVGGYVIWKLWPGLAEAATYSNALIIALSAALGLSLAGRPGRSFLSSGGAWALVIGQVFVLLFGKALFVWYGLAASCFLFLAAALERRWRGSVPLVPLLACVLLWIIQGGAWVGEKVDTGIQLRSATWVALMVGIGFAAVGGLRRSGETAQAKASAAMSGLT